MDAILPFRQSGARVLLQKPQIIVYGCYYSLEKSYLKYAVPLLMSRRPLMRRLRLLLLALIGCVLPFRAYTLDEINYADESLPFGKAVSHLKKTGWLEKPGVWVVDFYSPWCPTCHLLAPEFSRLAAAFRSSSSSEALQFGAVNTVAEPGLKRMMRINTHPVIMVIKVTV
jgi:thiol-disulfide isomerase/thioredoxin